MYYSIGIVLLALLLLCIAFLGKRRTSIRKVRALPLREKQELLSALISPFGYTYEPSQDIISSHNDAWQREFGYHALFDKAAAHLNMVFDYLPVYFDYQNKSWLLEFWKGQYGINTGAEIGLYYADRLLSPNERESAHYNAVSDEYLLPMSMTLSNNKSIYATLTKKTWWLTAFSMGRFSRPEDLYLDTSIIFPNYDMLQSFLQSLSKTTFSPACIQVNGRQVLIRFGGQTERRYPFFQRLTRGFTQFMNHLYCKLYLFVTKPFHTTMERLLYLYYLLPIFFRRTLRLRRYKKKWHR